jgi:prolyl-tRNA editing enzyme YbaK/EbsC (Cys-tRNA(Pro) deacylase)
VAEHPTVRRFKERLTELGLDVDVQQLTASTRTAGDAAAAVGVEVGQIVKSLVFVDNDGPVLCLCAGDRRVDTTKLGSNVRQANGDEVREATGFAIGGVPPVGHNRPVRTVVDSSLLRFPIVWCAAGTPNAVFSVSTEALVAAIPDAVVQDVA